MPDSSIATFPSASRCRSATASFVAPPGLEPPDLEALEPNAHISRALPRNFVDDAVLELLETLRLDPSPQADDTTFLRRARLALTGRLPHSAEVRAFLLGSSTTTIDKRSRLIDRLVESTDFVDYWTYRFANLLRVRALPGDEKIARVLQSWLRRQITDSVPFDRTARHLLTALGDSHEVGAAAFARMTSNARDHAELVSEIFLGARLRCANCHNHPLDRWTQDDYHGLAAVFARLDRGRVVRLRERGDVTHPATGRPAVPRLPGDSYIATAPDPRAELADWLVSDRQPLFRTRGRQSGLEGADGTRFGRAGR